MISNYMLFERASLKIVEVYLILPNKKVIVPSTIHESPVLPSCGGEVRGNNSVEDEAKIRALKQVGVKIDEFHLLTQRPIKYLKEDAETYFGYSFISVKPKKSGFVSISKQNLINLFSEHVNKVISDDDFPVDNDLLSFYKKQLQCIMSLPV